MDGSPDAMDTNNATDVEGSKVISQEIENEVNDFCKGIASLTILQIFFSEKDILKSNLESNLADKKLADKIEEIDIFLSKKNVTKY